MLRLIRTLIMKSRKKIKTPKASPGKKIRARRTTNKGASGTVTLSHRAVEQQFIGEHPEAFDPYIGEWVVLEGTSIVAHHPDPGVAVDQARTAGIKIPYVFWVEPKLKPNQGRLGL
jgi:hypothetical protein